MLNFIIDPSRHTLDIDMSLFDSTRLLELVNREDNFRRLRQSHIRPHQHIKHKPEKAIEWLCQILDLKVEAKPQSGAKQRWYAVREELKPTKPAWFSSSVKDAKQQVKVQTWLRENHAKGVELTPKQLNYYRGLAEILTISKPTYIAKPIVEAAKHYLKSGKKSLEIFESELLLSKSFDKALGRGTQDGV